MEASTITGILFIVVAICAIIHSIEKREVYGIFGFSCAIVYCIIATFLN